MTEPNRVDYVNKYKDINPGYGTFLSAVLVALGLYASFELFVSAMEQNQTAATEEVSDENS